ncbi:uncharacterized protein LOC114304551 [Camellia sinensis]|uniref:uncharacterized protein LOC114304551 n=1 Tax=Camellia sinensis TaxID=4442 RepID=UPI0010366B68|nr:uncharacterized protein LOC114304551 [Camellia sinensis]
MEFFTKVKAVKLRSHLDKYLAADDDKETVRQSRQGSARKSRWLVEPVDGNPQLIRLKGIHGSYLAASAAPFLLGMTGNKVVQAKRDDSSETTTEWQPIRDGFQVKLKAAAGGTYLRANGGTPPWRNTVTHDIPLAGSTHNWVLWEAEAVEIPENEALNDYLSLVSSFSSLSDEVFGSEEVESPMSIRSYNSPKLSTKKSIDSVGSSPPKAADGRAIYYSVADEFGNVNEGDEGHCITFKGNGVDELTRRLEDETGIEDIAVCSRSPLNGKLYPLRLQLPPNNVTMHVVVVPSSSKVARDFAKAGITL